MTNVGFIGTGTMGRPMATNLARAGFALHLYDIDFGAAQSLADELPLATAAARPRDVAAQCDIVVTMVPAGADVRKVALESDGLVAGFANGAATLIDMSSSEPSGTVTLANELAARGIDMIDAPVSGGVAKAIDGTLTLIVGGDDVVIDRCLPVLRAMGAEIFRTGPVGSGHAGKAINNLMNAAGLLIAGEALLIGRRCNIDPGILTDVIDASTGMNHAIRNKIRQRVFTRGFDSGFSLDLMVKDLEIALELARQTGTPAPFSAACRELWRTAQDTLGRGRDHVEVVRWQEQTANTELTETISR